MYHKDQERPYKDDSTASRLLSEVKHLLARCHTLPWSHITPVPEPSRTNQPSLFSHIWSHQKSKVIAGGMETEGHIWVYPSMSSCQAMQTNASDS
eukprot:scaffold26910_cov52-Attheya_sp.AAC.6